MLTLQQIEQRLDAILGDAYNADSGIRHSAFFQAASSLLWDINQELYRQEDEANQTGLMERQRLLDARRPE